MIEDAFLQLGSLLDPRLFGQFEPRLELRQYAVLVPLLTDPRRVPDHEVESSVREYVRELQLPVEEPALARDPVRRPVPREEVAQVVRFLPRRGVDHLCVEVSLCLVQLFQAGDLSNLEERHLLLARVDVHPPHHGFGELDPVVQGLQCGLAPRVALLDLRQIDVAPEVPRTVSAIQQPDLPQRPEPQRAPCVHHLTQPPVRAALCLQCRQYRVAVHGPPVGALTRLRERIGARAPHAHRAGDLQLRQLQPLDDQLPEVLDPLGKRHQPTDLRALRALLLPVLCSLDALGCRHPPPAAR